jgi:hypothetical protein
MIVMANVEFRYAAGQTVPHLDVSAMISALQLQPGDFEYARGSLHHVPSRHRFQFDRFGRVAIDAACGCATMTIKPEQTDELVGMFTTWRRDYWIPLETNREFAAHFSKPNAWGRLVREIRMAFRRFVRLENPVTTGVTTMPMPSATPAE